MSVVCLEQRVVVEGVCLLLYTGVISCHIIFEPCKYLTLFNDTDTLRLKKKERVKFKK